jgi:UDP-N-acetylmuramoyl-L-alanyl-D-glutamate--2,6-diaminopimelate ligase
LEPYITPHQLFKALELPTKFIGVTGTNGKTTVAFAISFLLYRLGYNVGTQGTLGFFYNLKQVEPPSLTTPSLLTTLRRATKYRPHYFVMEVSSHGLAQGRVEGIEWALKVFTSLSQDHLDYHRTMEEYQGVKEAFFADETPKVLRFYAGFRYNPAHSFIVDQQVVQELEKCPLIGEFNRYNLVLAVEGVHLLTGVDRELLLELIQEFPGVPGRMELVQKEPPIVIDYAHTPDGFEQVLKTFPDLEKVVIFGAGGNRDRSKRRLIGEAADRHSNFIILTIDNPRCEEPSQIFADLAEGIKIHPYIIIPDRRRAIEYGLTLLKPGRALFLLGKGAEEYIELCGERIPYREREVVEELLAQQKGGDGE